MGKYFQSVQGDCLSSLARKHGLPDYRAIYEHPNNQQLKSHRPNPNVINPGDQVYIPNIDLKTVDGSTEKKHVFVVKKTKVKLRLILRDEDEKPFDNLAYKIRFEDHEINGTTGSDGKIEEEIPGDCEKALLIFFVNDGTNSKALGSIPLKLGCLNPVEEITGVQARLNNLGFNCGRIDGKLGPKTGAALRAFQAFHELTVTGHADEPTLNRLRQLHDWQ